MSPIRSVPLRAPTSSLYGRSGGGATNVSPGMLPASASRIAAVSRTLRVTTPSDTMPPTGAPAAGPNEVRPRDGFKPTSPHSLAGMRIEPPPSLACAAGTNPAATAHDDPPLDPPVEWSRFQGFRHGPYASDSVWHSVPSSGTFVRPRMTNPADWIFCVK